jgi:hypothetical protein
MFCFKLAVDILHFLIATNARICLMVILLFIVFVLIISELKYFIRAFVAFSKPPVLLDKNLISLRVSSPLTNSITGLG